MRNITLGTLDISNQGKAYVNDALDGNRLSRGKYTERFENQFAEMHGCKYGIFMNSGTSALQVALAALKEVHGYKDGDEVLVPACTFIATSNIVLQNNMVPVFVDVEPDTFNLDPEQIEKHITHRTRAIIPVHLFGLPANMPRIKAIATANALQIIEDSCETVGSKIGSRPVGSFSEFGTFSTYVNHLIVGGVGGLVTTNNPELARISISLMAHGRDSVYTNIDADDGLSGSKLRNIMERRFRFERVGYSYRATELEAALALSELERWDDNVRRRRENAIKLTGLLRDIPEIRTQRIPESFEHAHMMFPAVVEGNRDKLLMFMEERGIETRYLFPLLSQPVYKHIFPGQDDQYPVAQHLARQGFMIGIHQGLASADIDYISDVIHGGCDELRNL